MTKNFSGNASLLDDDSSLSAADVDPASIMNQPVSSTTASSQENVKESVLCLDTAKALLKEFKYEEAIKICLDVSINVISNFIINRCSK